MRIFHAVESQNETRCGRLAGGWREEIFERKKLLRVDERDNALMRGGFGSNGELLAGLLENADASLAALGDQLLEARIMPLPSHEDVVKAPLSGFESLLHRVQAVENFHGFSLRRGYALDFMIESMCGHGRPHDSRSLTPASKNRSPGILVWRPALARIDIYTLQPGRVPRFTQAPECSAVSVQATDSI